MLGLMQDWPLLVSKILEHAEINHAEREVFSVLPEGGTIRTNYAEVGTRARKVAEAMKKLGVGDGDRVATLAWNTHRHVEAWFGVSGMGSVLHTINPRLFPEQIIYIANHAADKVLMFDVTFTPLIEKLAPMMKTVEHFVCLVGKEHLPDCDIPNLIAYEDLIADEPGTFEWPILDEQTACGLCYTSGTTGNPKGVLYSHRSNVLHTLTTLSADTININSKSTILPVVPMFHANAWGIPYSASACGAKMVLNGPVHDAPTLYRLIKDEGVTTTAAVPTIWMQMLQYLNDNDLEISPMREVTIGGAACPRSMIEQFQEKYGVRVNHAWGMTELSPLGSVGSESGTIMNLSDTEKMDRQVKQGRAIFGVEMSIKDDDGNVLPRDGASSGRLVVRGPWVAKQYFGMDDEILDEDGWFDTGDVAHIDPQSYMQITDRAKDVIKSGGEWISSIDLENAAVGFPGVTEAAVIGVAHPKWDERPLLIVTVQDDAIVTLEDMNAYLKDHIAKWWLPDDLAIVEEIPHTATGKISKKDLRETFKDYKLPTA